MSRGFGMLKTCECGHLMWHLGDHCKGGCTSRGCDCQAFAWQTVRPLGDGSWMAVSRVTGGKK